jgi:uncharacterized LabA/DUF88 family protein
VIIMESQIEEVNRYKIALLIDGDNAQPSLIEKILTEVGKYGQITIRRIYGDWTTSNMNGWKETLHNYAIQPMQQFRYTVGKNSTDSFMIIDAMDTVHSGFVNGFCIVSSDSDYTRLATRIRERGFFVMGIGEKKTPKSFVNGCNVFIYTENFILKESESGLKETSNALEKNEKSDPIPLLKQAFEMAVREDEWALLSDVGLHLRQLDPGFDPRTYRYKQLLQLITAYPKIFELKKYEPKAGPPIFSIRLIN